MTETSVMSPGVALDGALAGELFAVAFPDGRSMEPGVLRWLRNAHRAEITPSRTTTFPGPPCRSNPSDCGPGRLVGALNGCGEVSMGVDVSAEAGRLARLRGAFGYGSFGGFVT